MKTKPIKLRSFRIENNEITQSISGLLATLMDKLEGSKAEIRRMQLNSEDLKKEEDLISDFNFNNQNFLSGVILRICHAEETPNIPDDFLQKEKIPIDKLEKIELSSSIIYKEHYYFLLNNEFLITNLQSNIPIKRLQVYLNWLLEKERGKVLYEFTPLISKNIETKLSDISKIVVKDNTVNFTESETKKETGHKKFFIPLNVLRELINDTKSLNQIIENNIVSAELLIKFSKPRKMTSQDYKKIMGAYLKPISDLDDVSFSTRRNGIIKGGEVLRIKTVDIELTETKMINEQQLYQEMESYLNELVNENNT
jgi:hypothetical protein